MSKGAPINAVAAQRWSSRLTFVLAAAGAAVGLGNLWRFPFVAADNGGGAFVVIYLLAVAGIGFPIMLAELAIGRHGRSNAELSIARVIGEAGANKAWRIIGALSIFIPFIGIGYYSVVAGWVVDYLLSFIASGGFGYDNPAQYQQRFDDLIASPARLLGLHFLFMLAVTHVVSFNIRSGIERVAKIMMPALFILLIGLVLYGFLEGDFQKGAQFLLAPDFSKLTGESVLAAVGQAFFSLAVGIGALMTFGAYLDEKANLPLAAAQICIADTAVAILAGLAIFPIVFSFGLETAGGEGLVFVALPTAFDQMTGGYFVGSAFFILLFFAAFTTGIATLEPVVSWLEGRGLTRRKGAVLAGFAAWLVGAAAALSFNDWAGVYLLSFLPGWETRTIFSILDYSISNLLLPINGLLIALFVGWALPRSLIGADLARSKHLITLWRFFLRIIAPIAILAILILG
ncbi:sodium-dependent transporter [Iodidimonas gelatinilytica]|uniref:Transporter n=1 Tax=Iodidimonas gelatinilytica TaxID=1236966 RepID=A0A5A7MSV0_9PROT|nr:sodium-dependent transporter [Iodidimonas gelatinilytica]GEQ98313.1 sodium-dependent transporter [Iodidimonas gelatinilytica]